MKLQRIVEAIDLEATGDGTFKGRVIVAGKSKNPGRRYSEDAIRSGVRAFERGLIVADHTQQGQPPSVHASIGRIKRTWSEDYNGTLALYAEYYISESEDKLRTKIKEGIINGASIEAWTEGHTDEETGEFVIDAFITEDMTDQPVFPPTLALVNFPAAGGSIEWSAVSEQVDHATYEALKERRPDLFVNVSSDADKENHQEKEHNMEELQKLQEQVAALQEANEALQQSNATLHERMTRERESLRVQRTVGEEMAGYKWHTATEQRVSEQVESVLQAYVEHGGELDKVQEQIKAVIQRERDYLAQIAPGGIPVGNGPVVITQETSEETIKAYNESLASLQKRIVG